MSAGPAPFDEPHLAVEDWLSCPNVVMLQTDVKTTGGEPTGRRAISVGVVEKKPASALTALDFPVPPAVTLDLVRPDGSVATETVPTDVVQTGEFRPTAYSWRERPCPGGFQIGSQLSWYGLFQSGGTLGVTVEYRNRRCVLTNAHVIGDQATGPGPGLEVYQPPWGFWEVFRRGSPLIGVCDGTFQILTHDSDTERDRRWNMYDFAWCEVPQELDLTSSAVVDIYTDGTLLPILRGVPLTTVRNVSWTGASSGRRQNTTVVDAFAQCKNQNRAGQWQYWRDLISVDPSGVALPDGDSGSALIVTDEDKPPAVIGLMTMASDNRIMATRIPSDDPHPFLDGRQKQIPRPRPDLAP
ncbi:hypothetical protein ACFVFS_20120 [Kitasatospora sp. NPDC057692]|uniref:hypothetical protein n=1 Tax=Kitasatospora sp. NPDC057692 TaxID=3346215 RepID=UPI0036942E4A